MSKDKIFSGNQYYFVLKISISLKKACTIVCSEITFSKISGRFANQLAGFNIVRPFTERYLLTDFNCKDSLKF